MVVTGGDTALVACPPSMATLNGRWDLEGITAAGEAHVSLHRVGIQALRSVPDEMASSIVKWKEGQRPTFLALQVAVSETKGTPATDSEEVQKPVTSPPKSLASVGSLGSWTDVQAQAMASLMTANRRTPHFTLADPDDEEEYEEDDEPELTEADQPLKRILEMAG